MIPLVEPCTYSHEHSYHLGIGVAAGGNKKRRRALLVTIANRRSLRESGFHLAGIASLRQVEHRLAVRTQRYQDHS